MAFSISQDLQYYPLQNSLGVVFGMEFPTHERLLRFMLRPGESASGGGGARKWFSNVLGKLIEKLFVMIFV